MPLVSVIIPALNEQACLEQTLETLLRAEGSFEALVVDGGSSDATREIAARYCRTVTSPPGRAMQMNRGAQEARGEVLLFLHADAIFPRTGILSLETVMADPRVAGGNFDLAYEGDAVASRVFTRVNRWRRALGVFYGDSGIFVRREVFRALGGFHPLSLLEDYEFARRLVKVGKTVCLEDTLVVSARRWEEHGLWRTMAAWFFLHSAYFLGVPTDVLARHYPPIRRWAAPREAERHPDVAWESPLKRAEKNSGFSGTQA